METHLKSRVFYNKIIDISNGTPADTLIGQVYTTSVFGKIIETIGTAPCAIALTASVAIFF